MVIDRDEPAVDQVIEKDRSERNDKGDQQVGVFEVATDEVAARENTDDIKQYHDRKVTADKSRSQAGRGTVLQYGI